MQVYMFKWSFKIERLDKHLYGSLYSCSGAQVKPCSVQLQYAYA